MLEPIRGGNNFIIRIISAFFSELRSLNLKWKPWASLLEDLDDDINIFALMPQLMLFPSDFPNSDDSHSDESEHPQPLGHNAHQVKDKRDDYDDRIEQVELVEEVPEGGGERLHRDLREEQTQEDRVDDRKSSCRHCID